MSDEEDWEAAPIKLNVAATRNGFGDEVDDEKAELPPVPQDNTSSNNNNTVTPTKKTKPVVPTTTSSRKEPMTVAEKNAEALRVRRLVEKADAALTGALFGVAKTDNSDDDEQPAAATASSLPSDITLPKFLAMVDLHSSKDGEAFALAVGERLKSCGLNNRVLAETLKSMLREATKNFGDEDVTDLINALTLIKGEKLKIKQKTRLAAGKKPLTKPKLNESSDKGDVDIDMDIGRTSSKGKSVALDDDDFI